MCKVTNNKNTDVKHFIIFLRGGDLLLILITFFSFFDKKVKYISGVEKEYDFFDIISLKNSKNQNQKNQNHLLTIRSYNYPDLWTLRQSSY